MLVAKMKKKRKLCIEFVWQETGLPTKIESVVLWALVKWWSRIAITYSAPENWLNYSIKLAEIASGFAVLLAYYQNLSLLEPMSAYISTTRTKYHLSKQSCRPLHSGSCGWWPMLSYSFYEPKTSSSLLGGAINSSPIAWGALPRFLKIIASGGLVCTARTCPSFTRLGEFQTRCAPHAAAMYTSERNVSLLIFFSSHAGHQWNTWPFLSPDTANIERLHSHGRDAPPIPAG